MCHSNKGLWAGKDGATITSAQEVGGYIIKETHLLTSQLFFLPIPKVRIRFFGHLAATRATSVC